MISIHSQLSRFSKLIPNSRIKSRLKDTYRLYSHHGLLTELQKVPVVAGGSEEIEGVSTPFLQLHNGLVLYGQVPNEIERGLYREWRDKISPVITEETFHVAVDVVMRYGYPHTMPGITVPYRHAQRRRFHPQHFETVDDLPDTSAQNKAFIKQLFTPKEGESVLDIGAYIGFGALRMSQAIGPTGRVLTVEADPDALRLLRLNVHRNNIQNVHIVPKAIWHTDGEVLRFQKTKRQANSLVSEVVASATTLSVETTTVDAILAEHHPVDLISMTVNGAEVEAVTGMAATLEQNRPLRLSIAGWYLRDDQRICDVIAPVLSQSGMRLAIGRRGRVLAWR